MSTDKPITVLPVRAYGGREVKHFDTSLGIAHSLDNLQALLPRCGPWADDRLPRRADLTADDGPCEWVGEPADVWDRDTP
ncbi:hypothetical protein [Streptomyces sp. NBC_01089]|uniref:hypothetical protein n=1 Tax=Streptomyces sp. NBC_01089 TaxID=2903747 RepID=UPI00386F89C8|nr:hypothetical protein OG510_32950 [Streptomyces sp. NBC_01089]